MRQEGEEESKTNEKYQYFHGRQAGLHDVDCLWSGCRIAFKRWEGSGERGVKGERVCVVSGACLNKRLSQACNPF